MLLLTTRISDMFTRLPRKKKKHSDWLNLSEINSGLEMHLPNRICFRKSKCNCIFIDFLIRIAENSELLIKILWLTWILYNWLILLNITFKRCAATILLILTQSKGSCDKNKSFDCADPNSKAGRRACFDSSDCILHRSF